VNVKLDFSKMTALNNGDHPSQIILDRQDGEKIGTLVDFSVGPDGVITGAAKLEVLPIVIAAQEGGFMGGAAGEVHGAKLVGLLQRAVQDKLAGVVLLLESGGVRLQEANAGLIAVSEVIRAILASRAAGVPVVGAIGGQYGCFGGMGIAAACYTAIVMSGRPLPLMSKTRDAARDHRRNRISRPIASAAVDGQEAEDDLIHAARSFS
jgi:acetyl-CoA carboxylase beta subunit